MGVPASRSRFREPVPIGFRRPGTGFDEVQSQRQKADDMVIQSKQARMVVLSQKRALNTNSDFQV